MKKALSVLVTVVMVGSMMAGSACAAPVKDAKLGTQGNIVAPNDDPGPGVYRDFDTSRTSLECSSYEEYREKIAALEEINTPTKVSPAVDAEGNPLANDAEHPAQPWDGPAN